MAEMATRACSQCDGELDERFRFCPWCAAPQRLKIVEYFAADPAIDSDKEGLRVSRYFGEHPHSRFSVWSAGRAEAAVSLDDGEARRLARFLAERTAAPPNDRFAGLYRSARALRHAITR